MWSRSFELTSPHAALEDFSCPLILLVNSSEEACREVSDTPLLPTCGIHLDCRDVQFQSRNLQSDPLRSSIMSGFLAAIVCNWKLQWYHWLIAQSTVKDLLLSVWLDVTSCRVSPLSTSLPRAVTVQLTGTSSLLGFGCVPSWQGTYEQMAQAWAKQFQVS